MPRGLNTPKAIIIVLVFLVVSGFLYYRHQLTGLLAAATPATSEILVGAGDNSGLLSLRRHR